MQGTIESVTWTPAEETPEERRERRAEEQRAFRRTHPRAAKKDRARRRAIARGAPRERAPRVADFFESWPVRSASARGDTLLCDLRAANPSRLERDRRALGVRS